MIVRLRRKLTLLVIAVLATVTAGIIFSISYANYRSVDRQAYNALRVMTRGRARMNAGDDRSPAAPPENIQGRQGPRDSEPGNLNENLAFLSNTYTIVLNEDGSVKEWNSDRANLYTDEQVAALASRALACGTEFGRVGTQYFRLVEQTDSRRIMVVDARLERMAARSVMRTTLLVAALACAILSLGAWLLIGQMVKPVEDAFERQKQFVWDASHEFKTPLAVISANAEVLAGEIGQNEYLGYIQSEVKRTDRLVQNLLTLARMDSLLIAWFVSAQLFEYCLLRSLFGRHLPGTSPN